MNRLIALMLLLSLTAWGANPAFTDFQSSQFGVNGNKIRLKSGVVLTNPVIGSGTLTGKITSGNVTNDAGVRVAYLSDVTSGMATNAVQSVYTNGVALIDIGATNIDFVNGGNITVTGNVAGDTAIIGFSLSFTPGTAAYSNASAFDLSGVAQSATNKLDTDLRTAIVNSTNKLDTDLRAYTLGATNKLNTDLRASLQTGSAILSNVVSGASNRYVGSFVGLVTSGDLTNAAGIRVAYLSDTNGLGGGGSTYTNNSTGTPGKITGLGISTNLSGVTATATNVNDVFSYVLSNSAAIGDVSVELDRLPAFPITTAGKLIVGWSKTNAEIRAVTGISGNSVSFNDALLSAHAASDRVLWYDNSDAFLPAANIFPDSSTDSGWAMLQLLEEAGRNGTWVNGGGQSLYTQIPFVAPNSTRVKGVQINAKSGYPLGNTNVYMYMGRQGSRYSFTASAATDVITVAGGWSPPAAASNSMVAFYALGSNVLPQPLSNGISYFVMTNSSTALTVKLRPYDSAAINLTTDGTGVMCSEAGSGGKDYMVDTYLNGQSQPRINGLWANVQQQSYFSGVRLDNFETALRLTGQQALWYNTEIIASGIGIDMRKGVTDDSGAQFMYFTGLNIEQVRTNAAILGGDNNFWHGVHIETSQSTTAPIIDGSLEKSGIVIDGLTYGGSPVSPNTNTLFQMGTSGGFSAHYDLSHLYMSAADFDSIQLVLNDAYRGHRIYAYNSTNGPSRYIVRIVAPVIPDSTSYSSMFGGETFLGQAGRFSTLGQQHQSETFHIYKAGTNDTGNLMAFWRSDLTTNSGFSAKGNLFVSTNYNASDFIPVVGAATFAMSNAVLYMVTNTKTNLISDGR